MKLKSIETIFKTLNKNEVRYLVAGGLAVVAHGYVRFTADIDLILDMTVKNLKRAVKVFNTLGYQPRAPVTLEDFINPEKRAIWIREKGLTVFSLWNPDHPATEIDLFMEEPLPFEKAFDASIRFEITEDIEMTVIGFNDLISLKKNAGRPRDIDDIEQLYSISGNSDD